MAKAVKRIDNQLERGLVAENTAEYKNVDYRDIFVPEQNDDLGNIRYNLGTEAKRDEMRMDLLAEGKVISPVYAFVLKSHPSGKNFQLIHGYRRVDGVQTLNDMGINDIQTLPVIICDEPTVSESVRKHLTLNNAEPITPIEEGRAYAKLIEVDSLTNKQLAEQLKRAESHIHNMIKIYKTASTSKVVEDALVNNKITGTEILKLVNKVEDIEAVVENAITIANNKDKERATGRDILEAIQLVEEGKKALAKEILDATDETEGNDGESDGSEGSDNPNMNSDIEKFIKKLGKFIDKNSPDANINDILKDTFQQIVEAEMGYLPVPTVVKEEKTPKVKKSDKKDDAQNGSLSHENIKDALDVSESDLSVEGASILGLIADVLMDEEVGSSLAVNDFHVASLTPKQVDKHIHSLQLKGYIELEENDDEEMAMILTEKAEKFLATV